METIRSRAELKQSALLHLKGNWGIAIVVTLIVIAISAVLSQAPKVNTVISLIISGPLTLGMAAFYLRLIRKQHVAIADLFTGFSRFVPSLLLYLLTMIFVFLWSLLLIVPGIIAGLRYSMAYYIMNDHPELSAMEAIDRSKAMMDGHKWRYFVLSLSFIGWGILCALTLGIGLIWLIPYMSATMAGFYENLSRATPAQ